MDLLRHFDRLFTRVLTYCGRQAKVITFTIGWIRYLVWRTRQYVGVLLCFNPVRDKWKDEHQSPIFDKLWIKDPVLEISNLFLGVGARTSDSQVLHKNNQSAHAFSHFSNIFKIIHIYIYCSNSPRNLVFSLPFFIRRNCYTLSQHNSKDLPRRFKFWTFLPSLV